jgi:hypothetical protein
MKKVVLVFMLVFGFFSVTNGQIIEEYIKNDLKKIKKIDAVSILCSRKGNPIFSEINLDSIQKYSKFGNKEMNKAYYDALITIVKKDSIDQYWSENDRKTFGFDDFYDSNDPKKNEFQYSKYRPKGIIDYQLSDPIVFKNGKTAVFHIRKYATWIGGIFEISTIVMKKEKGKWVFDKKIKSNLIQGSITVKKK